MSFADLLPCDGLVGPCSDLPSSTIRSGHERAWGLRGNPMARRSEGSSVRARLVGANFDFRLLRHPKNLSESYLSVVNKVE